ncbi:transcriptional regulator [Oceanobacillus sp. E9]|uniref:GntR family transcriptional regulator n=1 Tax=Oceanobacillus kimchii TaxID=746691 RepID=A0ABQ5TMC2_9BACI|nr:MULTISPECIES: GntR family transcriptional regulator [Oceanobacillus]MBT2599743.1 GntR family transcriptional regulator [Oceanobacillus sp. ISL-74]OEH56286.1 transcriptional regulator [Oceanobacillus sp. E9]GLO67971.1 GntR family transcriptional regulator [Oceanobacillus kimchii]
MLLKEVAYQEIKAKILEEHYEAGQFLSERTLIDELGMSKTPIKNALVRLESEGFVTVSSKQGIIVNDISIERINDIYNLRIALETFNCQELYHRITQEQLKELEDNVQATKEAAKNKDVTLFATLDHEFHLAISEFVGNKEITRVLLNYQDHLRRITLRHLKKDPGRVEKFYSEHEEVLDALKRGDIKCVELMKKHLLDSKMMYFQ